MWTEGLARAGADSFSSAHLRQQDAAPIELPEARQAAPQDVNLAEEHVCVEHHLECGTRRWEGRRTRGVGGEERRWRRMGWVRPL